MSDLLNKASLVMIPSGYKEDVVYSAVPGDGSGDMAFTRASNGTRVNSAGLVEDCPWNLVQNSETFSGGWALANVTVTANDITAPNGTLTADKFTISSNGNDVKQTISVLPNTVYTWSFYVYGGTALGQQGRFYDNTNSTNIEYYNYSSSVVLGAWVKIERTFTTPSGCYEIQAWVLAATSTIGTMWAWGAQLNIGSTAKPYFPTTDRLNVPRLTYQNGGGGCPSLLLEKQSTNLVTYSEQFDNAAWLLANGGGTASGSVTANYGISPDGTQNADRIQLNKGNTGYSEIYQLFSTTIGSTYTQTLWLKSLSGTPKINFGYAGSTRGTITLTTEWKRYEFTYVSGGNPNGVALTLFDGFDPSTAQSIDVLAWGAQAEISSYPTSYIPTTSASATRVADVAYKTSATALIGQTEGTIFLDFVAKGLPAVDQYFLNLSDGSTANLIYIGFYANILVARIIDNYNLVVNINVSLSTNTRYKVAFAYKANDCILYINGTNSGSDTIATIPATSVISLNNFSEYGTFEANEAIVSKTRLTNAELASLTTI